MFKKYLFTSALVFSLAFNFTSTHTAQAAGAITMTNNGATSVSFLIASSATPSNFAVFFDSFTNEASPADLEKVTYNGVHPTAGHINSSSLIRFDFPIAIGTSKSGGTFDILAETYYDSTVTPNDTMNLANSQITDSAHPIITALSVASDGNDPEYAKAGDTVTVILDTTEDLDTENNMELYFSIDGNPTFDDSYYGTFINTSGNTWEFHFVVNEDDAEGQVEFQILLEDLGGQQDIEYYTEGEVTDDSFVIVDLTGPVISEVTPVTTPTTDTSPAYTFTIDDDGTISYGGSCVSATSAASWGSNTISFAELPNGTYTNCTITVTDIVGNDSNVLAVTAFTVAAPVPSLTLSSTLSGTTETSPIPITATFSEDVSGFAVGDITVGNGSASNFVAVSASVYTFDIIPTTFGTVTVDVNAGVVMDSNTNNNLAASQFSIVYAGAAVSPSPSSSNSGAGGYTTNLNDIPYATGTTVTQPTPSPFSCAPYLTTFLSRGDRNENVTKLQMFLASQNLFTYPTFTTFFGPVTFQAVKDFQVKFASDILAPIGLTSPTGFVGPMTLAKINAVSCSRI